MVGPMRLYVEQEHLEKAQHDVAVLFSRGVEVSIEVAEKLNARFFRFHPDLGLCADADGLWLCANGMK
ncbi:rRNA methyltransferase, partial [Acinetobacter johnsonii]